MELQIRNIDTTYNLSRRFLLNVEPLSFRNNVQPKFGQPGGVRMGDGQPASRGINLKYSLTSEEGLDADQNYVDAINEIAGLFRPDKSPFYLYDLTLNRRCEISLDKLTDTAGEGLERRVASANTIECTMLSGLWEDAEENKITSPSSNTSNGEGFTIDNDADFPCFPVIRIQAMSANPIFTFRNDTTGAQFTISSNSFVFGTEFIIDCTEGTVYLSDGITQVENSFSMADGSGFISFVPGENILTYESAHGAAFITITYRKKYGF